MVLVREGRVRELRGIGPGISARLRELAETGSIAELDELRSRVRPELVGLGRLLGIAPKRMLDIAAALGAETPEDFRRIAREGSLQRVPGIGPRAADRIIAVRRGTVIRGADDLRRLGVDVARGGHFMALAGHRLARRAPPEQLRLFPHGGHLPAVVWKTAVPPCAYR